MSAHDCDVVLSLMFVYVAALYPDLLQLLIRSPSTFLPTVAAWEQMMHEFVEFSTWLQQKDADKRSGKLDAIKAEIFDSSLAKTMLQGETAAAASSSACASAAAAATSASSVTDVHALAAEITRQHNIGTRLGYQEKQEIHYCKWMVRLRVWIAAFQIDILARQQGLVWFRQHVQQQPLSEDAEEEQLPGPQADPHYPVPLLYSLITRAANVIVSEKSKADAEALARAAGPKIQSEEEEANALNDVLRAPPKKGEAGRGRGRGRGRRRGGATGGRGGNTSPAAKRARRTSSSSRAASAAIADSADDYDVSDGDDGSVDGADWSAASAADDNAYEQQQESDDHVPRDAGFVIWFENVLELIGLSEAQSQRRTVDDAELAARNQRTADVPRFLELVRYVNHAQRIRHINRQRRRAVEAAGNDYNSEGEEQVGVFTPC